ncbi:glutamate receptor ionotropic, NMDA 2B-like [Octopus sinensis]|uniref:Glutamate receptor ionotropic, NMDA 2B-like n=1 Tax=Octopus sinensis TaxID=2607531 RepID=A0A6P7TNU3_9MOLL|nr:glutamate receptor ionotropic, NMDA 2B-like [Octopus sinensis]XP_036369739.1 glutamate receptor ionotropic, NMDA 2B-like [Octopus sinensis]XP_036369740.1 glutamate receptor ionotropic, NMDA 2B-like [Octopus sinensis]
MAHINTCILLLFIALNLSAIESLNQGTPPTVSMAVLVPESPFKKSQLIGYIIRSINQYRRKQLPFKPTGYLQSIKSGSTKEILDAFCNDFFRNNTIAIMYINNQVILQGDPSAGSYVTQLAHAVGIPVISWNPDRTMAIQEDTLVLELAPRIHHECEAMLSLLDHYNWTDFTIITTQADGYSEFTYTLRRLAKKYSKTYSPDVIQHIQFEKKFRIITEHIIQNTTRPAIIKNLEKLQKTDTRIILLYANRHEMLTIIEQAHLLGMTSSKYMWIISHKSLGKQTQTEGSLPAGILGISFEFEMNHMKLLIERATKIWTDALIVLARHTTNLNGPSFHLNMSCDGTRPLRWEEGKHLYRLMKNVVVQRYRQTPVEFKKDGTLKNVEINIVNLQRNRKWKLVGKWDNNGLKMHDIIWPGNSTSPPIGKPDRFFMRVVTLEEIPYVRYQDMESDKCSSNAVPCKVRKEIEQKNGKRQFTNETIPRCCVGLSIDLLRILSERIGFDFELFEVEDHIWGSRQTNGEWNGLVRSILDDKADFIMTSMKITPERSKAVDFTVPFLETGITIIVAIREGAVSPTAFLEPYDYPAWCLILVFSVHATGASIFIFEWLSPFGLHQGKTPIREHKFSLFRSFWLIWAMLFGASVNTDNPRGVSSRFLGNVWALFALVFLASYTANLAAFMITKEEFYDLSGIQDWRLMNPHALKPPFRFATTPNGSTETNLKTNYPSMYRYMSKFNQRDVTEGIYALKKK